MTRMVLCDKSGTINWHPDTQFSNQQFVVSDRDSSFSFTSWIVTDFRMEDGV